MAKKKKKTAYKEKTLAMEEAENLTVEQVSAKSDEIETENLNQESSLDKYIRQHRSDIETAKKERKLKAIAASEALDSLVKTAREDATADSETPEEEPETPVEQAAEPEEEKEQISETNPDFPEIQGEFDAVDLVADDTDTNVSVQNEETVAPIQEAPLSEVTDPDFSDHDALATSSEPVTPEPEKTPNMSRVERTEQVPVTPDSSDDKPRNYKKPIIIGLCALLLASVGGVVWHNTNQANQRQAEKTAASKVKKSEEDKLTASFNKVYAQFFIDAKQTKLKNNQFEHIKDLTDELAKLKNHPDYKTLKAKLDELKAEIAAIKAMNGNFDKPVITDGVLDKTAKVREGVKLSYTATENTALNTLLKAAVTLGQDQQKEKALASSPTTSAPVTPPASSEVSGGTSGQSTDTTGQAAPATTTSGVASSGDGLTTAQYQTQYPTIALETSKSRVPVDPNANLNDPAFVWGTGIRELVLQKCRDRGYITGNAYILLPASIQNGNGYYNLYKPDGTYLVSINCKTGYFVGNGAGHSDNLDY